MVPAMSHSVARLGWTGSNTGELVAIRDTNRVVLFQSSSFAQCSSPRCEVRVILPHSNVTLLSSSGWTASRIVGTVNNLEMQSNAFMNTAGRGHDASDPVSSWFKSTSEADELATVIHSFQMNQYRHANGSGFAAGGPAQGQNFVDADVLPGYCPGNMYGSGAGGGHVNMGAPGCQRSDVCRSFAQPASDSQLYGFENWPMTFGSSGGSAVGSDLIETPGGAGGGAVHLIVKHNIMASGAVFDASGNAAQSGSGVRSGAGAGGSVLVLAG